MADRGYLSIGEVLSLLKPEFADLTISKIRFLESQGLLDPERTPSGYRKFYGPDVERLRWILRQQHENYLPLKVIKGKLGTDPEADEETRNGRPELVGTAESAGIAAGAGTGQVGAGTGQVGGAASQVSGAADRAGAAGGVGGRVAGAAGEDGGRALLRATVASGVTRHHEARDLGGPPSGVSLNMDELAVASGLSPADLAELGRFGLMMGKTVAGTVYYDDEALSVAHLAAGFMRYGVEARHLRMYRTSAEREASFFEQVVTPMLKQRNPQARKQALDALIDLSQLGQSLRASLLRQALRDYTGP